LDRLEIRVAQVEKVGDPLLYSDEQLISDLAKIFRSAAAR